MAPKKTVASYEDEADLTNELYADNKLLVKLKAKYYKKETVESILREVGFKKVEWHQPVISQKGLDLLGKEFWEGYIKRCELGYFKAS